VTGSEDSSDLVTQVTPEPPPFTAADARRMVAHIPTCESLLSGDPEQRRAALTSLSRRADARSVALLRWSLSQPDADLAVEAGLPLEDLTARHEARVLAARAPATESGTHEGLLACAEVLAEAIHSGLADAALVTVLADEARSYYERAMEREPAR